jgi:hypothetical protein
LAIFDFSLKAESAMSLKAMLNTNDLFRNVNPGIFPCSPIISGAIDTLGKIQG